MSAANNHQLSMIERMERACCCSPISSSWMATCIVPMYEKFEAELKELKSRQDTKARAQPSARPYSEAGGLKAIR